MMFRAECLYLVNFLGVFPFIISSLSTENPETTKQNIVCYVLDEQLINITGEFWERYLPESKCTHWIYSAKLPAKDSMFEEQQTNALMLIKYNTGSRVDYGFRVELSDLNVGVYVLQFLEKFEGVSVIWEDDPKLEMSPTEIQDLVTARKNLLDQLGKDLKDKKMTQTVTCWQQNKNSLERSVVKFSEEIDHYILKVVVGEEDLQNFFEEPDFCLNQLMRLGVPQENISMGLSGVIPRGQLEPVRYDDVCGTELGDEMTRVVKALSCLTKERGLSGDMFWGISTDDYTGDICQQGTLPLLEYVTYASKHDCSLGITDISRLDKPNLENLEKFMKRPSKTSNESPGSHEMTLGDLDSNPSKPMEKESLSTTPAVEYVIKPTKKLEHVTTLGMKLEPSRNSTVKPGSEQVHLTTKKTNNASVKKESKNKGKKTNIGKMKLKPKNEKMKSKPKNGKMKSKPKKKINPKVQKADENDKKMQKAIANLKQKGFKLVCKNKFAVSETKNFIFFRRLHDRWMQMSCFPTNFNVKWCKCDKKPGNTNETDEAPQPNIGKVIAHAKGDESSGSRVLNSIILIHTAIVVAVAFLFG